MQSVFRETIYDVNHTAELLGKTPNYVWKLVKAGRLEARPTRPIRINRYAIQNYLVNKQPIIETLFNRN